MLVQRYVVVWVWGWIIWQFSASESEAERGDVIAKWDQGIITADAIAPLPMKREKERGKRRTYIIQSQLHPFLFSGGFPLSVISLWPESHFIQINLIWSLKVWSLTDVQLFPGGSPSLFSGFLISIQKLVLQWQRLLCRETIDGWK